MANERISIMEKLKLKLQEQEAIKEIIAKKKELKAEEQEQLFFDNEKRIDVVLKEKSIFK